MSEENSCYEYSGRVKLNEEYKKNIQEAKGHIRAELISETSWFEDVNGEISDMYGDLGEKSKNLFDFVEKVRRAFFFITAYHRDVLYGTEITMEDFQWVLIRVMEDEVRKHAEEFRRREIKLREEAEE